MESITVPTTDDTIQIIEEIEEQSSEAFRQAVSQLIDEHKPADSPLSICGNTVDSGALYWAADITQDRLTKSVREKHPKTTNVGSFTLTASSNGTPARLNIDAETSETLLQMYGYLKSAINDPKASIQCYVKGKADITMQTGGGTHTVPDSISLTGLSWADTIASLDAYTKSHKKPASHS